MQEKKKQDEFFKRSAQLSHESYEQWAEKSKAKIQQQVNNLKSRKSERYILASRLLSVFLYIQICLI